MKPLAIDLFAGLGGWTDGLLAESYEVVGFDIERHRGPYGEGYPAQLVLQDVLTIHGSQFKDAALIVASPPCQNYSYLAMPWSRSGKSSCRRCNGRGWSSLNYRPCVRCGGAGIVDNSQAAKALRLKWETEGPDNRLFDACFRIQREAIEATGEPCPDCKHLAMYTITTLCSRCNCTGRINTRYIPLVVENVRGAIPWVGRSAWNFGSFHLWGDVPALMPINLKHRKVPGFRFDGSGRSFQTASVEAHGMKGNPDGTDRPVGSWFRVADSSQGDRGPDGVKQLHPRGNNQTAGRHRMGIGAETTPDGTKIGGDWFRDPACHSKHGSRSNARKMASAMIAKIPLALSSHIASVYYPR